MRVGERRRARAASASSRSGAADVGRPTAATASCRRAVQYAIFTFVSGRRSGRAALDTARVERRQRAREVLALLRHGRAPVRMARIARPDSMTVPASGQSAVVFAVCVLNGLLQQNRQLLQIGQPQRRGSGFDDRLAQTARERSSAAARLPLSTVET